MSLDINLYKNRLDAYKITGKDGKIDSMKKAILDDFIGNPSHCEVLISGQTRDVHIVSEGLKGLRILCKPNETINAGDYVVWEDEYFLCTHKFPDIKVQTKGTIQKCNHNLKWIDKETGILVTRQCIEDARTLYTTGIKDEKVIEIPNGLTGIQLPYDEQTKKLDREDTFVFNKTKYKITHYDETTYEGLIVVICTEISISHLDDKVNEIADRWVQVGSEKIDRLPWLDNQQPPEEPEIPQEPISGIRYEITPILQYQNDTPYKIYFNSWQKYSVKKYVDDVDVNGNFTFTLSDTKVTISEITNNSCKVSVGSIVGKYVANLIVTDTDTNEIAIEQTINIKGR